MHPVFSIQTTIYKKFYTKILFYTSIRGIIIIVPRAAIFRWPRASRPARFGYAHPPGRLTSLPSLVWLAALQPTGYDVARPQQRLSYLCFHVPLWQLERCLKPFYQNPEINTIYTFVELRFCVCSFVYYFVYYFVCLFVCLLVCLLACLLACFLLTCLLGCLSICLPTCLCF